MEFGLVFDFPKQYKKQKRYRFLLLVFSPFPEELMGPQPRTARTERPPPESTRRRPRGPARCRPSAACRWTPHATKRGSGKGVKPPTWHIVQGDLSRDPILSRKPPETQGKRIRCSERTMVEKNGESTPRIFLGNRGMPPNLGRPAKRCSRALLGLIFTPVRGP